jgi:hypothetical protein
MVSIYEHIPKEIIHINDDYTNPPQVQILTDLFFQVGILSDNNFLTNIGVKDGKIQSILNKTLYFLPEKLGYLTGVPYAQKLLKSYQEILTVENEAIQTITEPVFYFMDYDSCIATGETYDILFYLLFHYKKKGLSIPLVIPDSTNKYFRSFCSLLEKWYGVSFYRLQYDKVYKFSSLYCIRTYQNIFFHEVKNFINETLINPIVEKYKDTEYYTTVGKIKIKNNSQVQRPQSTFEPNELLTVFCKEKNIYLFPEDVSEELKIYYLNKAKNIIVSWGSIYYIYINYYLANAHEKFISVLFHKEMMPERYSLYSENNMIHQRMRHCDQSIDQVYNNFHFRGEVIDNLDSLDVYIDKTALKEI